MISEEGTIDNKPIKKGILNNADIEAWIKHHLQLDDMLFEIPSLKALSELDYICLIFLPAGNRNLFYPK